MKDKLGKKVINNMFNDFFSKQIIRIEQAKEILKEKGLEEWYKQRISKLNKEKENLSREDYYTKLKSLLEEIEEAAGMNLVSIGSENLLDTKEKIKNYKEQNPELF